MAKGLEVSGEEDGAASERQPGWLRAQLARIDACFVTREIFLRSDDSVRYLRISATAQKTLTAATALAAVWLLSSTAGTFHLSTVIANKNLEIEQSKADYADLVADIRDYELRFVELTGALDANQEQLLALLEQAPENGKSKAEERPDPATTAAEGQGSNFSRFLDGLRGLAGQTVELRDDIAKMKTQLDSIQQAKLKVDSAHKQLVERLREKDTTIADLQGETDQLTQEIAELKSALQAAEQSIASGDAANAEALAQLDRNTDTIGSLRRGRDSLQQELVETRDRLADNQRMLSAVRTSKDQALAQSADREERIIALSDDRDRLQQQVASLEEALQNATGRLKESASLRADSDRRTEDLQRRLAQSEKGESELKQREETLQNAVAAADRRANEMARQTEQINAQMLSLKSQMSAMREEQIALIKQLSERTKGSVVKAETFLSRLKLPVEDLLQEAEERLEGGKGGPFVPLSEEVSDEDRRQDAHLLTNLVSLDNSLERLEAMRELLSRMPLGAPLENYRFSSGYGMRRDPINGRRAMHYGLDLVGPFRSDLTATASGVVTKAGWMAGYGRLVEVQHAFGFKTRYAHMKRISVKVGQRVERGDKVGQLGNSGRSTGPHLHYEVWYEGRRVNPYHYVKAEIDVLQN